MNKVFQEDNMMWYSLNPKHKSGLSPPSATSVDALRYFALNCEHNEGLCDGTKCEECEKPSNEAQPPASEPPSEPGDVEDIIKQWLKDNGYDGLFHENDCGCWMDRFRPCGESMAECVPGHKYKCTDQDSEFFDAWCIGPKEPTPEQSPESGA